MNYGFDKLTHSGPISMPKKIFPFPEISKSKF